MTHSINNTPTGETCRLCGGATKHRFNSLVLGQRSVSYFECTACGSLQTEFPDWLHEAYSGNLAEIDTGAAQRNLNNLAVVYHLCKLFGLSKVLDYGAGDGLLCRLLRDYNIEAYCVDKHASPTYAKGFEAAENFQPEVVVSFEVVEHFENPVEQLDGLFARNADLVFISTELYEGQDESWRYLMPSSGQHVFFYTQKALRDYAESKAYSAHFYGRYTLFVKKSYQARLSSISLRSQFLKLLLNRYTLQLFKLRMGFLRATGVESDFKTLAAQQQNSINTTEP